MNVRAPTPVLDKKLFKQLETPVFQMLITKVSPFWGLLTFPKILKKSYLTILSHFSMLNIPLLRDRPQFETTV